MASQVVLSRNIFFIGNTYGQFMYFNLARFPYVMRTFVHKQKPESPTRFSKSHDQAFLAISYEKTINVRIIDLANIAIAKLITIPVEALGVHATFFSSESRYLFVFPYNLMYCLVYDRDMNWSLVNTITTGYLNVQNCFLYRSTNTGLCLSTANKTLFSIQVSNYEIKVKLTGVNANRAVVSNNNEVFFLSNTDIPQANFYSLTPQCQIDSSYDSNSKTCAVCSNNCINCQSPTTCSECQINYVLISGKCHPCTSSQVYNSTTKTCISLNTLCTGDQFFSISLLTCVQCRPSCARCSSVTSCQYCLENYTLISNTCQPCNQSQLYNSTTKLCHEITNSPCRADEFFSQSQMECVQCLENCGKCSSKISCEFCAYNYMFVNGSCHSCGLNQLYNTTTKICDDVSNFCSDGEYFGIALLTCVQCLTNCGKCISTTQCQYCIENYSLFNESCQVCGSNQIYNSTTKLCYNIIDFCSGDQHFSIPLLTCVQCQQNCAKCLSTSTCEYCISNYKIISGFCQPCGPNQLYNSATKACDDVSDFCTGDQYFSIPLLKCVQCQPNCKKCSSTTSCYFCDSNYNFNDIYSCFSQQQYAYYFELNKQISIVEQFLQKLMELTLDNEVLQIGNSIPGNRILLSHSLSFFTNFDHLWLYVYHSRMYRLFFRNFLLSIRNLQNKKWKSLSQSFLSDQLNINWSDWTSTMNFKLNRTSQRYLQVEDNSSSFFANTLQFFILYIPLVFAIFIILRVLFFLLARYEISQLLREYSFKLFIVMILMEGNIESFSYYLIFDCLNLHNENIFQKVVNFVTLFCFVLLCWYMVGWYFIVTAIQERNSKYFFGNYHPNFRSLIHLTFQSNILNLCLGGCHILIEDHSKQQLITLAIIQLGYIILQLKSIRKRSVYRLKFMGWQNIIMSLMRIFLIFTLSFDKQSTDKFYDILNQTQIIIIVIFLFNCVVSFFFVFLHFLSYLIHFTARKLCVSKQQIKKISNYKQKLQHKQHYNISPVSKQPNVILIKQEFTVQKAQSLTNKQSNFLKPGKSKFKVKMIEWTGKYLQNKRGLIITQRLEEKRQVQKLKNIKFFKKPLMRRDSKGKNNIQTNILSVHNKKNK